MRNLYLAGAIAALALATLGCNQPTAPASITYVAEMNGANERPTPNNSSATGVATYVLTGNTLTYSITVKGLTTPANGSHLHIGGPAVAGPVILPYPTAGITTGQVTSGTIDLSQPIAQGSINISGDSLRALLDNGNAYANVHNSTFPGGEVRGQVIRRN